MRIKILRWKKGDRESRWQTFLYEPAKENTTVAQALSELNQRSPLLDIDGKEAAPVRWECNCLQGKCGACAMLINGFPALACKEKLQDHGDTVELMPLQKFPVIEDLEVDRTIVFDHLKEMNVWMEQKHDVNPEKQKEVFWASRCLQCGCCLEICTSYTDGRDFFGMAVMAPMARIIKLEEDGEEKSSLLAKYREHFYQCCEEFRACEHVCPAELPLTQMMAYMNREMETTDKMGEKENDGRISDGGNQ